MGVFPEARLDRDPDVPARDVAGASAGWAGDFRFPHLERVVSGAHASDSLPDELRDRGLVRTIVVTGRTLGASAALKRLTERMGDRCALVFAEAKQHVPSCSVHELARAIEQHRADCVISFGGGSPIDTVKAAIHLWLTMGDAARASEAPIHIAIPTTLSAGEFTAVFGITDEQTRVKRAVSDPRLVPRIVYTDPAVTLDTPAWLWAASGVRALDHAIETMYSRRFHPLSDAVAARGLAMLLRHLPASLETSGAAQLEHRLQCQIGAWLSVFGIANAGLGLSHALGHQIGPRWNIPHGVTSCITLPHAMRFMAEESPERFGSIASACGVPFDAADPKAAARACADRIATVIAGFGLPQRLRDVQVPFEDIRGVSDLVHGIFANAHGDSAIGRDDFYSILSAAY